MAETNGNGEKKPEAEPFTIRDSTRGVTSAYIEIAKRVVNGTLGTNEAKEATRALNGVPTMLKVELEAIKQYEKGSEKAKMMAGQILDIEPERKALADK